MGLLKELHRQHRGQAAEYIEVIPLDDVADRCGDDHLAKVLRDLRSSHIALLRIGKTRCCWHVDGAQPEEARRPSCLHDCRGCRPLPIGTGGRHSRPTMACGLLLQIKHMPPLDKPRTTVQSRHYD